MVPRVRGPCRCMDAWAAMLITACPSRGISGHCHSSSCWWLAFALLTPYLTQSIVSDHTYHGHFQLVYAMIVEYVSDRYLIYRRPFTSLHCCMAFFMLLGSEISACATRSLSLGVSHQASYATMKLEASAGTNIFGFLGRGGLFSVALDDRVLSILIVCFN